MRDSEFINLADQMLDKIEQKLEQSGIDLDCATWNDGVLEIELDNGDKIVINRHIVSHEIWVATRLGGFHFRQDGEDWRDTRDGRELMAALSDLMTTLTGTHINL